MTIYSLDRAPIVFVPRKRRRSWFARFIAPAFARFTAAVYESRMRSAQAVIARHRGFMPIAPDRPADAPQSRDANPPLRLVRDRRGS